MQACHEFAEGKKSAPVRRRQFFAGCMGKLLNGRKIIGIDLNDDRIEACKGQMSKNQKETYWESLR